MFEFTEKDGWLIIAVRVVPRASKSEIVGTAGGALKIRISAAPVDGAANAELIKILANHFKVTKSAIEILKGQTSKTKLVKINGAKAANLPDAKTP